VVVRFVLPLSKTHRRNHQQTGQVHLMNPVYKKCQEKKITHLNARTAARYVRGSPVSVDVTMALDNIAMNVRKHIVLIICIFIFPGINKLFVLRFSTEKSCVVGRAIHKSLRGIWSYQAHTRCEEIRLDVISICVRHD